MALGAAHALSPGHGKALAAAYLVGRRARPAHAAIFGGTVTVAHTAVVFVVGCLALVVERTVGSDALLRGMSLASAVMVISLGIVQLSRRWREAVDHSGAVGHSHALPAQPPEGLRGLVALGASAGLTPCPSALALLLSAIALHRYGFGLVLVLAFSVGVAATLTVAGLLVVMARRALDRIDWVAPAPPLAARGLLGLRPGAGHCSARPRGHPPPRSGTNASHNRAMPAQSAVGLSATYKSTFPCPAERLAGPHPFWDAFSERPFGERPREEDRDEF